jgi:predicted RNase H-like HicB family nuclease
MLELDCWVLARQAVIIEADGGSYSAYVPDLPGCFAAGKSVAEVERLIREAIDFHIEGLRENGDPVPRPTAAATTVVTR